MTGVGRATGSVLSPAVTLAVEIKSYNHRFLEISVKAPNAFAPIEDDIRRMVQGRVSRGHIIVNIQQDREPVINQFEIDQTLVQAYIATALTLKKKYRLTGNLNINTIMAIPGVIRVSAGTPETDGLLRDFKPIFAKALDDFLKMKENEGQAISRAMVCCLDLIDRRLDAIEQLIPQRDQHFRQRLAGQLAEFENKLDRDRFYQEIAYLADRLDITEEFQRLRSHLNLFRQSLAQDEHPGRRLYFLLQEMQREANTLSVKANFQAINEIAVQIKEEIEKIREQAQNLE